MSGSKQRLSSRDILSPLFPVILFYVCHQQLIAAFFFADFFDIGNNFNELVFYKKIEFRN